jgi:hypothetical protein
MFPGNLEYFIDGIGVLTGGGNGDRNGEVWHL